MKFAQQDDLLQFGRLILALCCNNLVAGNNLIKSMETVTRNFTPDLKAVILFLISKPSPTKVLSLAIYLCLLDSTAFHTVVMRPIIRVDWESYAH